MNVDMRAVEHDPVWLEPVAPHRPELRRLARLGAQLDLWDDRAHVWGDDSCWMVDGPFWSLELALGRRRYRASGSTYGTRYAVIRRLLTEES